MIEIAITALIALLMLGIGGAYAYAAYNWMVQRKRVNRLNEYYERHQRLHDEERRMDKGEVNGVRMRVERLERALLPNDDAMKGAKHGSGDGD